MKIVMATSSSDDSCSAPRDFHLSSSLDSGSRFTPNTRKCPLCKTERNIFHCKECIEVGKFNSTKRQYYSETFSEKRIACLQHKQIRSDLEQRCVLFSVDKQKAAALCEQIRNKKEQVLILKLAITEKRELQKRNKSRLDDLRENNNKLCRHLPKYKERVEKLEDYVVGKCNDSQIAINKIEKNWKYLKTIRVHRIKQLTNYIFPITKRQTKVEPETSDNDITSAINEATMMTYVRSRWVSIDNAEEMQHTIVAPSLPASGNYSGYCDWVAQNRDKIPNADNEDSVERNPAYRISAALTYTAQLVSVLAFYLDVKLPHKLFYGDFCSIDMTDQQFIRRVARLNANILQLCFTQHTDLHTLQPTQTLHNILQLLDTEVTDLGRPGPLDIDNQMATDLEQQLLSDLHTSEDSDSEESDTVPYEWEAVPHVQISDTTVALTLQSTHTIPSQQASSIAGGLMNSAAATFASIWRGWTGR